MLERIKRKIRKLRKMWYIMNSDKHFIIYAKSSTDSRVELDAEIKNMSSGEIRMYIDILDTAAELEAQNEANMKFVNSLTNKNGRASNN